MRTEKQQHTLRSKIIKYTVYGIIFLAFIGCTPKVQEADRKAPQVPTVKSNDTNLIKIHKRPFADLLFAQNNLSQTSNDMVSESVNMMKIGNTIGDEIAVDIAEEIYQKTLKQTKKTKELQFNDSIYLTLVEQQSRDALAAGLSDAEKQVLAGTELIYKIIDEQSVDTQNITSATVFSDQLRVAEKVIQDIIKSVDATDMFAELKIQVLNELSTQTELELKNPKQLAVDLAKCTTLSEMINVLNLYIPQNAVVLTPEDTISLQNATKLGGLIDKIRNEESAMQALAQTWFMLTAEERKLHFKSSNEKLYDFLRKKDAKDIKCLIEDSCKGLIKKLILNVGVYPAIKDYGVKKIQEDLRLQSMAAVNQVVQQQSALQLNSLNVKIKEKLKVSVEDKLTSLHKFQSDFKKIIATGLSQKLNMNALSLTDGDLSDSFKYAYMQAENLTQKDESTQFMLIEKMLQFMNLGQNLTAMQTPLQLQDQNIKEVLKKADPRFYVSKVTTPDGDVMMRANDQAWSLMFYSKMIQQLADWKQTPYDNGITKYLAQDFISDLQSEDLNKNLFSKQELVGMALSLAAQTLKQLQTDKSPVYLLDENNNRISIKSYLDENYDNGSAIVVHAAVSDLKNGIRSDETRISDINLMIQALNLFYEATSEIELSQSESLKDESLRTEVLNARKQIRLVILTLANFISNQMTDKNNSLYSEFNFQTGEKTISNQSEEIAQTIESLLIAYNMTKIDIYKFTALELYYSLNRNFYSDKVKFYQERRGINSTQVNSSHALKILAAVIPIRKHLNITSQIQFDRIFENWYAAMLLN